MKTFRLKPPFKANGGYAFIYSLGEAEAFGDTSENPKASPAYLLEDGKLLGPAHALHYQIREVGNGAFSHWGRDLIFSSSDLSDPNTNGRVYELCLPASQEILIQKQILAGAAGGDPEFSYQVLRSCVNTNGSAFAAYLAGYRNYRRLLDRYGITLKDKTVLEIGSGPNPGTALAFLLQGVKKFYANDNGAICGEFPSDYASIIQFLTRVDFRDTEEKDVWAFLKSSESKSRLTALSPDFYQAFSETPAEAIDLPDNSLDLILSVSVLEHVTKPQAVLQNTQRMLKPGGLGLHFIDLRDHSSPAKPLAFLKLSQEEYAPKATENRWRASDFLEGFKNAGYAVKDLFLRDQPVPMGADGNMDMMAHILKGEPIEKQAKKSLSQIKPWVTSEMRAEFHQDFKEKSLEDLSVTGLIVLAEKE